MSSTLSADARGIVGASSCGALTKTTLAELLDHAPDAMVVTNASGKIMLVNRQAEILFGYAREELLAAPLEQLLPERFRDSHVDQVRRYFLAPSFRPMSVKAGLLGRHKGGREIPIDISLGPVHTEEGMLVCAAVRDVTERNQIEQALKYQACHDSLTGALNRRHFHELLAREWERGLPERAPLACVMLDIDYFKKINDTYGHAAGDAALKAIAELLQSRARADDLVCRYGGEEFCVVLAGLGEREAADWAEETRAAIAALKILSDERRMLEITASLGVAVRGEHVASKESLLNLADQAMLAAKESGRNRVMLSGMLSTAAQSISGNARHAQLLESLVARDLMTTLFTCLKQHDSIQSAAEYFLQLRQGAAPVIDDGGCLLGLVTERDLIASTVKHNPWLHTVSDVMQADVVAYEEQAPARQVLEFLNRSVAFCVVVVRQNIPTGIITRGSLLRWFYNWARLQHASPDASSDGSCASVSKSPDRLRHTSTALADRCLGLHRALVEESDDLAIRIVGEATRLQELVNDLLGHCQTVELDDFPESVLQLQPSMR